MADARNYEQYRREVLDRLGVEYYDEDITEFSRWRLKVFKGLTDLFGEENIIQAIENWLDEHPEATTTVEDGAVTLPKLGNDVINKINEGGDAVKGVLIDGTELTKDSNNKVEIPISYASGYGLAKIKSEGEPREQRLVITHNNWNGEIEVEHSVPILNSFGYIPPYLLDPTCRPLYKHVLKTLSEEEYNYAREVTVYYDGDVLPEVRLYNEPPIETSYPDPRRFGYEIEQVTIYTTNDHPEYGENKASYTFETKISSLTKLKVNSKMICETNANRAEGGDIVH